MTRHQRRKRRRLMAEKRAEILNNRALRVLIEEKHKASLTDPRRPKRSPKGMGNLAIYSGAGKPVGYTRPLKFSKGECK